MKAKNIFLIGPMGAGKTTIGRYLAREMSLEFIDTDQEVEQRTGADVAWIFDIEGEAGFRKREQQVIDDLTQRQNIVLATGGGAITTPENRAVLGARGVVVYLQVTLEEQFERTQNDQKRPLLQTPNLNERLQQLAKQREPLYEELADIKVRTDQDSIRTTVANIINHLTQL